MEWWHSVEGPSFAILKRLINGQARCLKIPEKVSFSFASEASYVQILSGQKFIKNAKKWLIEACSQTELLDMSILIEQKLMENAKIEKFK